MKPFACDIHVITSLVAVQRQGRIISMGELYVLKLLIEVTYHIIFAEYLLLVKLCLDTIWHG